MGNCTGTGLAGPGAGGGGGGDGDAALLLLGEVVHHRGPVVHFPDLVALPGEVQDPFGHGRLARVDVGGDADVPNVL